MASNSSFGMRPKIIWVSGITWASVSKFQPHNMFRQQKQPENAWHKVWAVWWILNHFNVFYSSHSCTRVAKHYLDEESTIEEVLFTSTRYDQEVFPVSSCNTPYLSVFMEGRYVDRPFLIKQGEQHHFGFWFLLINIFYAGFATMESRLWLVFLFRIVMMNPWFVNFDDMREKV